mgnify:CR=1 FL=1
MRFWFFILCCLLYSEVAAQPRIAIIIDDIGYRQAASKAAIELDPHITVAVIPRSPYGRELAAYAHQLQREIIIHLPMAANGTDNLDPGGITPEHATQQIHAAIDDAFQRIPNAVGLNNHMGSRTTESTHAMTAVMQSLAEKGAFFVDSRTSSASVGESIARDAGVPHTRRHVFLDNEQNYRSINRQFNELLRHARQHGSAVAIGHPYPETIAYLKRVLPLLHEAGIEVVPVSRLITF